MPKTDAKYSKERFKEVLNECNVERNDEKAKRELLGDIKIVPMYCYFFYFIGLFEVYGRSLQTITFHIFIIITKKFYSEIHNK